MVNAYRVFGLWAALVVMLTGAPALSQEKLEQHVQIAEIIVDPPQLENYKAAVAEQIEAAIRLEPGVLVLYSVVSKDDPNRITVFEIYRDREAYLTHLKAPHFLKYKATVEPMVKSLKLIPAEPIMPSDVKRDVSSTIGSGEANGSRFDRHQDNAQKCALSSGWIDDAGRNSACLCATGGEADRGKEGDYEN